jgi:hypothetical protein
MRIGRLRAGAAAVAGSLVTHPIVWFGVLAAYPRLDWWLAIWLFELFALGAETLGYRLIATKAWRQAALLSFTANAVSFSLGLAIQRLV